MNRTNDGSTVNGKYNGKTNWKPNRTPSGAAGRIAGAFDGKKAFIAFVAGGDPDIETTEALIALLADSGVDMVEIGIPFSDPIAEGLAIQRADERALSKGYTVNDLFAMVRRLRANGRVTIPLVFMTYMNPVFAYGIGRFMATCAECGMDGVIVPDVPYEERGELAAACAEHGVCLISMIAPTSDERVAMIAKDAEGFLYCVSSLGVTGVRGEITTNVGAMVGRVKKVTDIPCAVGFGISTPEQARELASVTDGVIIGSAIVEIVGKYGRESAEHVRQFVESIKAALTAIA